MKIGILGGTGLLGKEIKKYLLTNYNLEEKSYTGGLTLTNQNISIVIPYHFECDVNDYISLKEFSKYNFDFIIHAASYTQERFKKCGTKETYKVNCVSPSKVCEAVQNTPIIYISTDYVFDGKTGDYKETDAPNPLGFYAKTKWYAEGIYLSHGHRVIRTSFCPLIWPYEFAFEDKFASRDYVDKIAALVMRCSFSYKLWSGILHVGTERKSFYELAKLSKLDVKPNKIISPDVPPDTSFNLEKLKGVLGNDWFIG